VKFINYSGLNGKAVLKPLSGTRGRDVFMVRSAKDPNLLQIIDVILRQGLVMVQSFIPSVRNCNKFIIYFFEKIIMIIFVNKIKGTRRGYQSPGGKWGDS